MPTHDECVCCTEINKIIEKVDDLSDSNVVCITDHPGFSSVCLNPWVLQAAYYQYRQEHGTSNLPTSLNE